MPLPNLLVIGAGKAGTTSLHSYLDTHPDVSMSRRKELNYFIRDDYEDSVEWYANQFEDRPIRGESSPSYTMGPTVPCPAQRIADLLPDARLIYLVREPVSRTVAGYAEAVHLGRERRRLAEALSRPDAVYIEASRYDVQLDPYLAHFNRTQILVLDQADLRDRRGATMKRVFDFLGLDPTLAPGPFTVEQNTSSEKVAYRRLGYWLIRRGWLTMPSDYFVRGPLIPPLRRFLSVPIDRHLPREVEDRLIAWLRPNIESFTATTGLRIRGWDYPESDSVDRRDA